MTEAEVTAACERVRGVDGREVTIPSRENGGAGALARSLGDGFDADRTYRRAHSAALSGCPRMRCSHRPDGGFRNRRPRGGYSDRDMPGAVHGVSYTKSSEHPNQKGSVLGFCPRTAEHRYPCARLAHCRNPNVGVPEFTYQRPYWRERLGGKRRQRTRCELCWGNGRSPTHLPGLRCVGLSGRLSATVVPPEPRLQILCRRTATPIPQIRVQTQLIQ